MANTQTVQMIGKYRILGELGRGGMGVVYLAEDTTLLRKVALKVMNPALAERDVFLEQFRAEAHALAAIHNPHVVRIHSFDTVDGSLLIDMELLEGGSLADVMEQKAVPVLEAIALCHDVLSALSACHSTGLIHRDIKPANVLFNSTGHACVADFGLAAAYARLMEEALERRASTGMLWGTPCYAPPEAWDGAPPTPAWDIYATGVVLYEAITRTHPFNTSNPLTLLREMNQGVYAPLRNFAPDTPPWLDELIRDMLQPLPDERLPDATEALGRLPAQEDISRVVRSARSPTVPVVRKSAQRTSPIARPRRSRVAGAATIVTLIFVGAILAAVLMRAPYAQTQTEVFENKLPVADSLATLWKAEDPDAWQVYDTYTYETGAHKTGNWLVRTNPDDSIEITMTDTAGLARLRLDHLPDSLEGQGGWAAHPNGDLFQLDVGVLSGKGSWVEDGRTLLVGYDQRSSYDGRSWNRSVLATPSATIRNDTAFLLELEQQPVLQSLLFNELTKMDLSWARDIFALLPAMANSRVDVARATGAIVPDGRLDEDVWATPNSDAASLPGYPLSRGARLHFRDTGTALVLGIACDALAAPDARIDIVFCANFQVPVVASEKWHLTLSRDGVVDARRTGGGELLAWDTPWRAAICDRAGCGSAEVEIPFEGSRSQAATIMRLNVGVSTESAGMPALRWGYPDLERVEHGILASLRDD